MIPLIFLYGIGRADLAAKIHLLELPAYALLLWLLVPALGAEGAALAWSLRAFVDALLLFAVSRRLYPAHQFKYAQVAAALLIGTGALSIGCLMVSTEGRFAYGFFMLALFAILGWKQLLTQHDRVALARVIYRRQQ